MKYIINEPDSLKYITEPTTKILDIKVKEYENFFEVEKYRDIIINYFDNINDFRKFVEEQGYSFFLIMAEIHYGVDDLMNKTLETLSKLPPIREFEAEPAPVIPAEEIDRHEVKITVQDDVYFVEGEWLLQVMKSVNFDDYESVNYFQRVLTNGGVIDALREKGIEEGDTVSIYDLEFEFVE